MKIRRTRAVTLIADASYCHRSKVYGWAFFVTHSSEHVRIFRSGGGTYCKDSIAAELLALENGISLLVKKGLVYNRHVVLVSDSRLALAQIDRQMFKQQGARRLSLRHIEGHQDKKHTEAHVLHRWCDRQARHQMRHQRRTYISRIRQLLAEGDDHDAGISAP